MPITWIATVQAAMKKEALFTVSYALHYTATHRVEVERNEVCSPEELKGMVLSMVLDRYKKTKWYQDS